MSMIQLLNSITNRLIVNDIESSKVVLLGNMIEIEGVINIVDYSKDLNYDYDYKVITRDSVDYFTNSILAIDTIIKEIRSIENFKSGSTVENEGKKFMLVPVDESKNSFYILDLNTFEVNEERVDKIKLYRRGYTIVE